MALNLVGEHTLNCVALELLSHLLNDLSDASVRGGLTNFAQSSLVCIPSGKNAVSLGAANGSCTHHDCGGGVGSIPIKVRSAHAKKQSASGQRPLVSYVCLLIDKVSVSNFHLHFGNIALFQLSALVNKRRVVTHNVVD